MQRRDVVRYLGAAFALPFLPRNADAAIRLGEDLHRRLTDTSFRVLSTPQQMLVTDICEMIIPETDTPGAVSVKVPQFIDLLLAEWASDEEKSKFVDGLSDIDARAAASGVQQQAQRRFVDLAPAAKTELLSALDKERDAKTGAGLAFGQLKSMTVYGYFTSKPVYENVLETRMFFDGYKGDVPFTSAR